MKHPTISGCNGDMAAFQDAIIEWDKASDEWFQKLRKMFDETAEFSKRPDWTDQKTLHVDCMEGAPNDRAAMDARLTGLSMFLLHHDEYAVRLCHGYSTYPEIGKIYQIFVERAPCPYVVKAA